MPLSLLCLQLLGFSPEALAQSTVDPSEKIAAGRESLQFAEFEAARSQFSDALESENLTRPQLLEIFENRAKANHALGFVEAAKKDASALLSLNASYRPDQSVPPDLAAVFNEARLQAGSGISLVSEPITTLDGIAVQSKVENDIADLVERIEYRYTTDSLSWQNYSGSKLSVPLAYDQTLAYTVTAVGPGNAVLATLGTKSQPLFASRTVDGAKNGGAGTTGSTDIKPYVIGGAVAVGVIVIVVIIAVAASSGSSETQLSPPMQTSAPLSRSFP